MTPAKIAAAMVDAYSDRYERTGPFDVLQGMG